MRRVLEVVCIAMRSVGDAPYRLAVRLRPSTDTEPDLVARKVAVAGWSVYAAQSYLDRKGRQADVEQLAGHDVIRFDPSMSGVSGAQ